MLAALCGVAAIATVVVPADVASAGTFNVACGSVYGPGGLVDDITTANASGPSVINLAKGCTYILTTVEGTIMDCGPQDVGLPTVTGVLTINGSGATITRSTAGATAAFGIVNTAAGSDLTVNQLSVANGNARVGAGIYNHGRLTLSAVTVRNNTATCSDGGGIENVGTAVITSSRIIDNAALASPPSSAAFGGGIENNGTLTVTASHIDNNTAVVSASGFGAEGGGLSNFDTATLINSTVNNNRAIDTSGVGSFAAGGGIENGGSLTLDSTQVSANLTAAAGISWGGGIIQEVGTATVQNNSRVTNNGAAASVAPKAPATGDGGGIYVSGGTVSLTTGASVTNNRPNNCAPPLSVPGCVG